MSQQVNLYQPIFRRQEKKFSAQAMFQALGVFLAGILLMYAYTQWQVGSLRADTHRAEELADRASKRLDEVTRQFAGKVRGRTVDEEIARLEGEIAAKQQVYGILQRGVFSNTEGFSPYFTALARQYVPGMWLTGFDIVGAAEHMSLQGRSTAKELPLRYVQRLANENRFGGIEFRTFQLTRASPESLRAGAQWDFVLKMPETAGAPAR